LKGEFEAAILESGNYLSLSPLVIDKSVYAEKPTQTPEIYYFTGNEKRKLHFAQYKNELALGEVSKANKRMTVKSANISQPKLDELYAQVEKLFKPFAP
jgi:hypothetical protein